MIQIDAMGEKAKRMPPRPRAILNGMTVLPQVDAEWHPVKDMWVLPGRAAVTSQELRDLARDRGWSLKFLGNKNGGSK